MGIAMIELSDNDKLEPVILDEVDNEIQDQYCAQIKQAKSWAGNLNSA